MPFVNNFNTVNFIDRSVQPTGTPDIDANFLNYLQGIVDAQGDGLASYSALIEALQITVAGMGTPYTDSTFITGLDADWISNTQLNISSGACYTPAVGDIVEKTTATTYTASGLANNTWYYLYATDVGGDLAFAHSPTAPVSYMGRAKQKSGDSTQRLIGAFRTHPSDTRIMAYRRQTDTFIWQPSINAQQWWDSQFLVLNNRQAATNATMSYVSPVPVGTRLAWTTFVNYANQALLIGDAGELDANDYDLWIEGSGAANQGATVGHWVPINDSRATSNRMNVASSNGQGAYGYCMGYILAR